MKTLEGKTILTTIPNIKGNDLSPNLLRQVNINPNQIITITIKTETEKAFVQPNTVKKRKFEFLHNGIWDDKDGATDLAENHDHYLYDVESCHE